MNINSSLPDAAYMRRNWLSAGSDKGLSPIGRQAITWTNADLLSIGLMWTSFNEIGIGILSLSLKKCIWKCCLSKRRPFCLGGDELTKLLFYEIISVFIGIGLCDGLAPNRWQAITETVMANGLKTWCYQFRITRNHCTAKRFQAISIHRKIFNIRRTKSQKWFSSRLAVSCLCPIHWSLVLSREWRCSWSSPDRQFFLPTKVRLILDVWRAS